MVIFLVISNMIKPSIYYYCQRLLGKWFLHDRTLQGDKKGNPLFTLFYCCSLLNVNKIFIECNFICSNITLM